MGESGTLNPGTLFAIGEDGSYRRMGSFVSLAYGTLEPIHFDEIFRITQEPISFSAKIDKCALGYLKYICGLQTNNWKKSHGYPMRRRKAVKHRW